ncbi:MAG: hypothetical protein QF363_07655 [Planctomycetaceae bacterium]|jgi:hypothetical protein|nr:hypothetical protein [Planctomycetaceae bacterium]
MFKKLCAAILVVGGCFAVMDIQAEASHRTDAGNVRALNSIKTVHVPRKYSQAVAIAKAMSKYPGWKFAYIKSTSSVWVVVLKK